MSTHKMWQSSRVARLGLASVVGPALLVGLLLALGVAGSSPATALAQGPAIRYVAPAPTGDDAGNDCTNSGAPCATVQHAVDEAHPSDEIRVASGVYTDLHVRPRNDYVTTGVVTQVVYIDKTVTIRGGYTTTNWTAPDPVANPTTLDAEMAYSQPPQPGRVLYITGDINPTIEGLRLTGGSAQGLGGEAPSGDRNAGGGIYVFTATVTIKNNQILGNRRATVGGGLYFLGSENVTLAGNTLANNHAFIGGGGIAFRNSPGARLVANAISKNETVGATAYATTGGAAFEQSHNASLIGNTISENLGQDGCGGLTLRNSTGITLERNIIISNVAGGGADGGGICTDNADVLFINNVIADNRAGNTASGLGIVRSSVRMMHTTVARNSGGHQSGIYVTNAGSGIYSSVAMTNTILVSQEVGIWVDASNTADINGVLWYNNGKDHSGPGTIILNNEHTGDPAFADDGYHLTFASAAIDKGVDAGVLRDIDGDPRPCQLGPDLGADEISCRYLPLLMKDW